MAEGGNANGNIIVETNDKTSDMSDSGGMMMDRFFVKQRSDLMFELRQLKHGEKAVTEGETKQKIEKFFAHYFQPDNYASPVKKSTRPENVVGDMNNLFQSRPVSNLLQSFEFRQDLENVVRGTMCRQEQEMERAQRLRVAGLVMAAAAAEHFSPVETLSTASTISSNTSMDLRLGYTPQAPPPPPFFTNNMTQSPQPFVAPNANGAQQNQFVSWQQFQWQQFQQWQQQQQQGLMPPSPQLQQPVTPQAVIPQAVRPTPQAVIPQSVRPTLQAVIPQTPWLLRRDTPQTPNQGHPLPVNSYQHDQNRREDLIADISNLVQRQLVSSTLESNFRGRLEYVLGDRLANAGHNGQRVMEFVQSLRPTQRILRNDFSHLGINAPRSHDSHGATALPSLEFESIRRQMEELKNMVQLTFDLQMDTQRAIRQEVAAALTGRSGCEAGSQASTVPANEGHCLICLEKSIDSVLYQCGHMCVCLCCGLKLKSQGNNCPMCRAPIRDVIRAYRCHDE